MGKESYREEVEKLIASQRGKREHACPYDGQFCEAPLEFQCRVPVFLGDGHEMVIGWAGACPRKRLQGAEVL